MAATEEFYAPNRTLKPRGDRSIRFVYLAFTALLTLPILLPSYPPLVDYPNNLSRADILSRYSHVEQFRNLYTIQRQPIANLAIDLVVPPLARAIGVFAAGKLFLVLVLAVYAAGCYLLCGVTQDRPLWLPMVLLCFFYNTAVATGFMNYIAGVAVYLVAFACWLIWSNRWTATRLAGFAVLALCCYFAHLSSIVMLGISVLAAGAWESRAGRLPVKSIVLSAAAFVLPGVLFLIFMRGPGRVGTVGWNSLVGKIEDIPLVVRTYSLPFDVALLAAAIICVLLWIRTSSGVTAHPATVAAGTTLLLFFLLSPKDLFTSNAADMRFVWPASVLLAAAFRPRIPSRFNSACLAALLVLWTVRTTAIWFTWEDLGRRVSQMVRMLDQLPRGATVYPLFFADANFDTAKRDFALRHVVCYAVVTRDAYVPTVSAMPAQQPLVQKAGLPYASWTAGRAEVWRGYDYLWTYKAPPELLAEIGHHATLVARASVTVLWRLNRRGEHAISDLHLLPLPSAK